MPHIAVISELELGSHKAHAINVIKTAGGFARLGHTVTLLCRPPRWAIRDGLKIDPAPLLEQYAEPGLMFELQPFGWSDDEAGSLLTGRWAAQRARDLGVDAVFARHFAGALESLSRGLPTVMETHAYVGVVKPILDECLAATRRGLAVSTISPRLREHYIARGGDPGQIHIVPDGVDLSLFSPGPSESPFEGRGPHVVYCGHLYDYKGVPTVLEAAALAAREQKEEAWRFQLVGGTHEDQTRLRAAIAFDHISNVSIHGHVPHSDVPPHLWHADVLLLPPSAKDPSANWTSPVKLGEYLASGKPVVASAIAGLKDWVDAPAVRWFEPDDAASLRGAIAAALAETQEEAQARRAAAAMLAQQFSYPNRARRILAALAPRSRVPLPRAA